MITAWSATLAPPLFLPNLIDHGGQLLSLPPVFKRKNRCSELTFPPSSSLDFILSMFSNIPTAIPNRGSDTIPIPTQSHGR